MKLYATSRITRRLGERFFFKAERDASPKSVSIRRPYPPGMHGKRARRGGASEFGAALQEKQKIRYLYGVSDTVLKRYVKAASRAHGKTKTQALLELLEGRIDNVLFRLGLAPSRRIARQLISHGHILLGGKRVRTPSILVQPGTPVSIHESSRAHAAFEGLTARLKKYEPPQWLRLDTETWSGEVVRKPTEEDNLVSQNLSKIIEFYAR